MATTKSLGPKKIVYLWGAGATHGEAQHLGASISLLMGDTPLAEGIAARTLQRAKEKTVLNFGTGPGIDIEKLISLLAASGIDAHLKLAERLRTHYFDELRDSLNTARVIDNPKLAIRLLEMHSNKKFQNEVESLSGIITTNHDGLLQVASEKVFGAVNLGFKFVSRDLTSRLNGIPPLLQLHGSFTWRFGMPIQVASLRKTSKYSSKTVWIPPTILKESKSYPFNKLSGIAYELLTKECDVLRVVGASLTQNDWNILSLIFNAQRHREHVRSSAFRIELIMPHGVGEKIKNDCAFIKNLTPIGYLTDGRFAEYKEEIDIPPDSDLANPFAYWLNQKIEYHENRHDIDIVRAATTMPQTVGEAR